MANERRSPVITWPNSVLYRPEPWGLYDTQDNLWLGNEDAPLLYEQSLARVAERVIEEKLGWSLGRVRAKRFEPGFLVRRLPDAPAVMSTLDAIKVAEGEITSRTARERFR